MAKHQMTIDATWEHRKEVRVISYKHGYLWIGDDLSGNCYGTLDNHKAIRMAKAILRRAALEKKE